MHASLRAAFAAALLIVPSSAAFAQALTIDEAVSRARAANPSERAAEASIAAARAGRLQAGLKPNPTISVEGENLAGSGNYSVLEQAEITGSYNQLIERGGKRRARVALAERDIAVAEAGVGLVRITLAQAVQNAFLDALVADQAVGIAEDRLVIERGLESEALRRVRSAKDPLFVETRAAARVADARIAVDQAKRRAASARMLLASFWGGDGAGLELAGDPIAVSADVAAGGTARLAGADQRLAEAELARADAQLIYERTRTTQDWTVSGGARFLRDTNDVALVAGVTIPLGRSDRNQGNIARAEAERLRLQATAEAALLERQRTLARLTREAENARLRATAINRDVYPKVTKALAQVQEGYARGGFSFRDMQEAADAIFAAQADYLDALTTLRANQAEIDRLTGRFDTQNPAELPR